MEMLYKILMRFNDIKKIVLEHAVKLNSSSRSQDSQINSINPDIYKLFNATDSHGKDTQELF